MQEKVMRKFDLRLFDDGGAGAGAAGGEGGAGSGAGVTSEAAVPTNPNRRQRRTNPLANVQYGKQPEAPTAQEQPSAPAQEATSDPDAEWKTAKEKYKDRFNTDVSAIVQERLRNSKQAEETLGKLAPVFEGLGKKYGKEASDIDGIIAAYTDDDSLYEEDAAKAGMTTAAYKQLKALEADKAARDARDAQTLQQQKFQEHVQGMVTAFERDIKPMFPNADLRAELQNPKFQRLTSPEVGVSVKDAYYLIHRSEIEAAQMQVAAQKAQQKLSQSVQSGIQRPTENGTQHVSSPLEIRDDPSKWSKADREEVKRQARMGKRIIL